MSIGKSAADAKRSLELLLEAEMPAFSKSSIDLSLRRPDFWIAIFNLSIFAKCFMCYTFNFFPWFQNWKSVILN